MVPTSPQRLLYVTIEYCHADLFSGNGICARSQVRGLAAENVTVLVICGRPVPIAEPDPIHPLIKVLYVPLETWFTTDRLSSHAQFAVLAARLMHENVATVKIGAFLAVDWTGMNVLRCFVDTGGKIFAPVMYLSFRMYSSMAGISPQDLAFYQREEGAAIRFAASHGGGVIALCDADELALSLLEPNLPLLSFREGSLFRVIHPMLREEFFQIALADEDVILDFDRRRIYLVSLVRFSEDKGPHRFVKLLQMLQRCDPNIWERTGVVPMICGADSQPEYARKIKAEIRETVSNCVIMDRFLTPTELSVVLKNSILNIHCAEYEAYGLTIVEAAAMGCPTVLNRSGIGAAQLLDPEKKASAAVDVTDDYAFANVVRALLDDAGSRQQLACSAYLHAISWTETEHVRALLEFTNERMQFSSTSPEKSLS